MATSSSATPDTPITLKVNFDGVTRRFKLPLRDVGANVFEDKLRSFLSISPRTAATFERYSDSAATYVLLEPSNVSVYKQLYRAAKAKQKLKLRVTSKTETEPEAEVKAEETKGPKPVTIEDEPEPSTKPESTEEPTRVTIPTSTPVPPPKIPLESSAPRGTIDTIAAPQNPDDFPDFIQQWRSRGMPRIHLRKTSEGAEVIDFIGPASADEPMVTLEPLAPASSLDGSLPASRSPQYRFSQTASKLSFADLIREARERELAASKRKEEKKPAPVFVTANAANGFRRPFTVCCNSCDRAVPDAHFHCSTCDDGDFDLCQDCVNQGITCYDDNHWLIKRTIKDGSITYSTTQIAPKTSRPSLVIRPSVVPSLTSVTNPPATSAERSSVAPKWSPAYNARTCNCCVEEFSEKEFLHCTTCEDYDLCKHCFAEDQHGHHPKHGFTPAVPGTLFETSISARLAPGRNIAHNAVCDGCDKYIRGVRHKCLDCPDWDYCQDCVQNASFIHQNHRFVSIFEPISDRSFRSLSRSTHTGICCDGPLCSTASARSGLKYIVGVRYKCAVCNDTDFCANCEASPANTHNKTHPLIKFQTPVRHVSVTTTGEHEDGKPLPQMGDQSRRMATANRSTETVSSPRETISMNSLQTVVDVKPTEPQQPEVKEEIEIKKEVIDPEQATLVEEKEPTPAPTPAPTAADLVAIFKHDTVADGTAMPPNHTFEQTWVLKNEGTVAWPAGCSVQYVGGDYMGAVDPTHPAGIHELVSASESTVCYNALQPGQEFPFTVLMRTPDRPGKVISYWRLTTKDGLKFGHKLWCDVDVYVPAPKVKEEPKEESRPVSPVVEAVRSQMIIPKLEHESPSSSIHESAKSEFEVKTETDTVAASVQEHDEEEDDFEDCADDEEWAEESDDGFLTDEEYDVLDASDEEYLSEQQKMVAKK